MTLTYCTTNKTDGELKRVSRIVRNPILFVFYVRAYGILFSNIKYRRYLKKEKMFLNK